MTDRLRNMSHPDWDYFGDPRVGIPAEDCVGLLTQSALEYPGQLLRIYKVEGPSGLEIEEDGSFTLTGEPGTARLDLFVNGLLVGNISYWINGTDDYRIITGGGTTDVYNRPSVPPPPPEDMSYLDNIENAPEWGMLSEESRKEYKFNREVSPKKKRIVYLIRRR